MRENADELAVRVRIRGRVQGVAFRARTAEQARACGVRGWVRNRLDGSVEAFFRGDPSAVRKMVEACRAGPPAARVTDVEKSSEVGGSHAPEDGGQDGATGFMQRPTV